MQYPAVANAVNFHQWVDPVDQLSGDNTNRPITFSANGTFSGFGDGCSSIDAILANRVASSAILEAEVLSNFKIQHRPIRLTLVWDRIWQIGYTLHKTAPSVWDSHSLSDQGSVDEHPPWNQGDDVETCWSRTNSACIQVMLDSGATWGSGPQMRGQPIQFRPKKVCPGQLLNGHATNLVCSWLRNALGGLREIEIFLTRNLRGDTNRWIQHRGLEPSRQAPCAIFVAVVPETHTR